MAVFSSFVENTAMLFRTEIKPKKSIFQISHSDKLLSVGSCFADCMGQRFQDLQFDILSNPFGVLYNPISIFGNLQTALHQKEIDTRQIVKSRESYFHYHYHSEISANSKDELSDQLNEINSSVFRSLKHANRLIITLGTAFVYYLKGTTISVANCHRMPSEDFEKRMLSVDEIMNSFSAFYNQLKLQNSDIKVLITISPVRHTKDTLELNTVSKAVLRQACYQIQELESENVSYFPSFEIMMDDLRDYRFYKEDLIHPNQQAETYIWEKFSETYFLDKTTNLNKEIAEIQTGLNHRAFNKDGKEYTLFLKKLEERVSILNDKIPVPRLLEKMALKLSA